MRKVAIVARGGTCALAPWRDTEWEIWGMPWISYPRVTHLFECHTETACQDNPKEDAEWKVSAFPEYNLIPLYCSTACRLHLSPSTRLFTIEDITKQFPRAFIENSIPYMLARAAWEVRIYSNIEEVGLWGCHMTGRAGVESDRASVLYWIGILEGMGVTVTEAPGSPLFISDWEAGRYGVDGRRRTVTAAGMERNTYTGDVNVSRVSAYRTA